MLRKTAAIAVLIVLVTSLFAGSVTVAPVHDQAAEASNAAYAAVPGGFAGIHILRGMMSLASGNAAGIVTATVAGGMVAGSVTADQVFVTRTCIPGASAASDAGPVVAETAGFPDSSQTPDFGGMPVYKENGLTMVMLANETSIEQTDPAVQIFTFNARAASDKFVRYGLKALKEDARLDGIVLHTPTIVYGPHGVSLGRYDLKTESHNASDEAGGFKEFTGHLEIPWPDASGMPLGPPGAGKGAIEVNGSIVVDTTMLAKAIEDKATASPTPAASSATDDPYNNAIAGGQTNWHKVNVADSVKSFNVDVKWQNANDSLRLMVYTPDGKILGPYDDSSDGVIDGRIDLNIANPSGVATGDYYLKVTDTALSGKDEYYVKTY